jgi:hypothetical protein
MIGTFFIGKMKRSMVGRGHTLVACGADLAVAR